MHDSTHGAGQQLDFHVPTGGGPETYSAADLASPSGVALVLFLRHHHCASSRKRVRAIEDRIGEFGGVTVVAALPDDTDRAGTWERRYDLSFPVLADPDFEAFRDVTDWLAETPGVALIDTRGEAPTVTQLYSGAQPQDCPGAERMAEIATEARRRETTPARTLAD